MCSMLSLLSIKSPPTTSLLLTSHGTSFRSPILVFPETFTHTRRVFPGHTFSLTLGCVFPSAFSPPIDTRPLSTCSMRFLVQSLFHPCRVKFSVRVYVWRSMSAKIQLLNFACTFGIRCCSFTICTYICNSTFKFPISLLQLTI